MKRSTGIIVTGGATALLVLLLWFWIELTAMRRELDAWKAAQVSLVASRATPHDILQRSRDGPDTGSLVKGDDGSVEFVIITGPQWHYATFHFEAGKAVKVTFSVK